VIALTEQEIATALARIPDGLAKYQWIQDRVWRCDVTRDTSFQTRYNGFYRVRRGGGWRAGYFGIMQQAKSTGITFGQALRTLLAPSGRIEASFASKLVATLDPDTPVIDRFVLSNFGLRLPYPTALERERKTVAIYEELCARYEAVLRSRIGRLICARFSEQFPMAAISDLKKIDLVLWQHRG
jgi:hypothetical protein